MFLSLRLHSAFWSKVLASFSFALAPSSYPCAWTMPIDRWCLLLSPLCLLYIPILAPALCLLIEGACFFLPCACSIFLSFRLHSAYWSKVLASFSLVLVLSSYPCACTMLIDRWCLLLSPLRLLYLSILSPALCLLIEGACFFLPCACSIFLSLRLHYAYWSKVLASFSLVLVLSFYPCACTTLIDRRCLLLSPLCLLYLSILAPAPYAKWFYISCTATASAVPFFYVLRLSTS